MPAEGCLGPTRVFGAGDQVAKPCRGPDSGCAIARVRVGEEIGLADRVEQADREFLGLEATGLLLAPDPLLGAQHLQDSAQPPSVSEK